MLNNFAIVIPIHNGLPETKIFLKSLCDALDYVKAQNRATVIIINDGSTDGSTEFIAHNFPWVKILNGDGKQWWSGSVNIGVKYALKKKINHIILFNNDNIVNKNYFRKLDTAINKFGPDVIIASKVINLYPKKHVRYAGKRFDRKTAYLYENKNNQKSMKVNTAGGMGVLIPVSVFNKIGFFNAKKFPQKCGDADFYLRAERRGVEMYYEPDMIVYDNNNITGFKNNNSIKQLAKAYSYPKGYMNLKTDTAFYLRHFSPLSFFNLAIKNVRFILGFFKKKIIAYLSL